MVNNNVILLLFCFWISATYGLNDDDNDHLQRRKSQLRSKRKGGTRGITTRRRTTQVGNYTDKEFVGEYPFELPKISFTDRSQDSVEPSSLPSSEPSQQHQQHQSNPTHSPTSDRRTLVTIIGAGAAGLSASYTLNHHGMTDFIILEASDDLGGRVKADTSFTNDTFPLDLGASFVQYPEALTRILQNENVMDVPTGTGLPNFVGYSYYDFFKDYIAPRDSSKIQYDCRVIDVDYSSSNDEGIAITCEDGTKFISGYVIVTVPLSILKDGDINFSPPLPTSMTADHPGWMWGGFKIFFEFTEDFVTGSFCFPDVPGAYGECLNLDGESLFWDISSINGKLENGNTIVEGYVLGEPSDQFTTMADEEITQLVLELMDEKYDGQASRYLVNSMAVNWSTNPNIRGSLSSVGYDWIPGNPSGSQNIGNKVWIAGEAFPVDGENGWVDAGTYIV